MWSMRYKPKTTQLLKGYSSEFQNPYKLYLLLTRAAHEQAMPFAMPQHRALEMLYFLFAFNQRKQVRYKG